MANTTGAYTKDAKPNGLMGTLVGAPKKRFEVLDPGHRYAVKPVEYGDPIQLVFLKKRPHSNDLDGVRQDRTDKSLVTEHDGLTNEALLEVLISRLHFLQSMNPCFENEEAIGFLKVALNALERRTYHRQARGIEGTNA